MIAAPTRRWAAIDALWLPLIVLAAAALVRGGTAGLANYRGDEAFSIRFSQLPLDTLLAAMAVSEPNPPLQFLFLREWIGLVGLSEVALRWPSVLTGILTTALAYRLGGSLIGRRAALLASAWVAVQPFLVWYAQDLRAYASLSLWFLVAAWCAWEGLRRRSWVWWIGSAAAAWLAMALHYFAALSLLALALAVAISPGFRATWRRAIGAYAGAAGLYLPWALYVWPLLSGHEKSWLTPLSAAEVVWRTLVAYSTGGHWAGAPAAWLWPGVLILGALLLSGLFALTRAGYRLAWLLALGPATPLALGLLSLWRPTYAEHYAIPGLVGCLLIAAAGLDAISRRIGPARVSAPVAWAVLTPVLLASLAGLWNVWTHPDYAKAPNWRGVLREIEAQSTPDDVVWVNLPDPALEIYLAGRLPVENAPPMAVPAKDSPDEVGRAAALQSAAEQVARLQLNHRRVFFVFSPGPAWDPDAVAAQGLSGCCELIDDRIIVGQRIQIYDTPRGALAARRPLSASFSEGMNLTGYRVERVSDRLHLTLFWRTATTITADYTVFVHLVAEDGFQVAGADGDPRGGTAPTSTWAIDTDLIDPHPLTLPEGLGAGPYYLEIGWYLRETGGRLPLLNGGDALRLPDAYTFR
ncbi:MAG: glycosyltransferase family 39 protein [Anaerolineales bacterium]|nr:glycosyltransferase family 39 protein [Anaerolineales bacterium]